MKYFEMANSYYVALSHNRSLLAPLYDEEMEKRREQHIEKF
jgi:hypothetical protein